MLKRKTTNMMKSMNESKKKTSVILITYQSMNTSIKEKEINRNKWNGGDNNHNNNNYDIVINDKNKNNR